MSEQTSDPRSACHNAPVKLVGGQGDFSDREEGITMHYECEQCHEACDLAAPPQEQPAGREAIRELLTEYRVPKYRADEPWVETYTEKFEQLIASRLRAQLDELEAVGPENRTIHSHATSYANGKCVGFNEANDQWRALLAKARKELN